MKRKTWERTFDASVWDFEVRLEVVMARFDVVEVIIQHPHTARPASRTVRIEYRKYVDWTADETKVLFYTAADAHASVAGMLNDDHLAEVTFDAQVLGLAESILH